MHSLKKIITWFLAASFVLSLFAQMAKAEGEFSVAGLEQAAGKLFISLEKTNSRAEKIKTLENFHQGLRQEIHFRANLEFKDAAYWKAVDLDVTVINLLDRNCSELKKSLSLSENQTIENSQALELIDALCAK